MIKHRAKLQFLNGSTDGKTKQTKKNICRELKLQNKQSRIRIQRFSSSKLHSSVVTLELVRNLIGRKAVVTVVGNLRVHLIIGKQVRNKVMSAKFLGRAAEVSCQVDTCNTLQAEKVFALAKINTNRMRQSPKIAF